MIVIPLSSRRGGPGWIWYATWTGDRLYPWAKAAGCRRDPAARHHSAAFETLRFWAPRTQTGPPGWYDAHVFRGRAVVSSVGPHAWVFAPVDARGIWGVCR